MSKNVQKQQKNNVGGITGKGFMPGKSGNPNGRPKGQSMTAILNKKLAATNGDKTVKEQIADNVIEMALKKDRWAIDYITDRTDGRSIERIENKNVQEFTDALKEISEKKPEELLAEINQALENN